MIAAVTCPEAIPWQGSTIFELSDVLDDLVDPPAEITTAILVQVAIFDISVDPEVELAVISPLTLVQVGVTNNWRETADAITANGFSEGQRLRLEYTFDGGPGIQGYFQKIAVVAAASA